MLESALSFRAGQYSLAILTDLVEKHQSREQVNKKYILGFLFSYVADTLAELTQTVIWTGKWVAKSEIKEYDSDSRVL